ncbi:MAG: hypothetical protein IT363_02690 [Methanoregulaceae archaeon]|nr:hypothetical protein [Methanoregulaceae archaeon]
MAWRAYNTVNGQILGETSSSGARPLDYELDALGSVVGTIKTNGTLENTYRYAGYGQQVNKTGLGSDPRFLWVGSWGYRSSGLVYVRERTYTAQSGRWTAIDPMWPLEPSYGYASASPATFADPSGLSIWWIGCHAPCASTPGGPCEWARQQSWFKAGTLGTVTCCNGVKMPCVYYHPYDRFGIWLCIRRHEESHVKDCKCTPGKDGPCTTQFEWPNTSECKAHMISIECMRKHMVKECLKLSLVEKWACVKEYEKYVCDSCYKMKRSYGCKELPKVCDKCPFV